MPFPPKPSKKKDDEDFERFAEMIRPIFLRMRLTDMLKMNHYAKYMKDIVSGVTDPSDTYGTTAERGPFRFGGGRREHEEQIEANARARD